MEKHWNGYLNAISKTNTPFATTDSRIGVSGFLDLKPQNNLQQYDAMNSSWLGVSASNSAIGKGLFSTDAMPLKNTK